MEYNKMTLAVVLVVLMTAFASIKTVQNTVITPAQTIVAEMETEQ